MVKPEGIKPRHVYFIYNPATKLVKIGISYNVMFRLRALQTEHIAQLQLLGYMAGGRKLEKLLHDKFDDYWVKGEWFTLNDEISKYIRQNSIKANPKQIIINDYLASTPEYLSWEEMARDVSSLPPDKRKWRIGEIFHQLAGSDDYLSDHLAKLLKISRASAFNYKKMHEFYPLHLRSLPNTTFSHYLHATRLNNPDLALQYLKEASKKRISCTKFRDIVLDKKYGGDGREPIQLNGRITGVIRKGKVTQVIISVTEEMDYEDMIGARVHVRPRAA